jgi:hypothetical protein
MKQLYHIFYFKLNLIFGIRTVGKIREKGDTMNPMLIQQVGKTISNLASDSGGWGRMNDQDVGRVLAIELTEGCLQGASQQEVFSSFTYAEQLIGMRWWDCPVRLSRIGQDLRLGAHGYLDEIQEESLRYLLPPRPREKN